MGKGIPRMGIYSTPDSTRLPDGGLRILHDSKCLLDYLAQQVVPAGIGQFLIVLLQDPQSVSNSFSKEINWAAVNGLFKKPVKPASR